MSAEATPEAVGSVAESVLPAEVLAVPLTIEERFPYIRFLRHGDQDYSAFLGTPVGFGDPMLKHVTLFCDGIASGAGKVTVLAGAGTFFAGDVKAAPWAAGGTMKPVEDILVVRGSEDVIEEVLAFVDLFFNGGPQIEIQAEIFEITNTDLFERGVKSNGGLVQQLGEVGGDGSGPFFRGIGGGFPATNIGDFSSSGTGGIFSLAFLDDDILVDVFLQFLRSAEGVDIVSRPRVVTRNGVPAKIDSSEEIPYLFASTISTATGITGLQVKEKKAGVSLWVQPFLLGNDTIHLVVEASASRIGRSFDVGTDSTGKAISIPSLNTRSATAAVSVRNGDRVFIGGLRLREKRKNIAKVPILGDIPILGLLFSSEEEIEADTEVMFVITPRIKTRSPSISQFTDDLFDPFADDTLP